MRIELVRNADYRIWNGIAIRVCKINGKACETGNRGHQHNKPNTVFYAYKHIRSHFLPLPMLGYRPMLRMFKDLRQAIFKVVVRKFTYNIYAVILAQNSDGWVINAVEKCGFDHGVMQHIFKYQTVATC